MKEKDKLNVHLKLKNLKEGKEIILVFNNGQMFEGKFEGLDDDLIMLRSPKRNSWWFSYE